MRTGVIGHLGNLKILILWNTFYICFVDQNLAYLNIIFMDDVNGYLEV